MEAAERSLFLKFIESFAISAKEENEAKKNEEKLSPTSIITSLKDRKESLEKITSFNVNDIVLWKDGLKNKRLPEYQQPCIVLCVHNPPIEAEWQANLKETLDIEVGFITEDNEFLCFSYDSRRFELYNPAKTLIQNNSI